MYLSCSCSCLKFRLTSYTFKELPIISKLKRKYLSGKKEKRGKKTKKSLAETSKYQKVYHSGGEGNGTPLQYSCLENPMDGGTWWAAIYGVAQSWTRLKRLSSSSSSSSIPQWKLKTVMIKNMEES